MKHNLVEEAATNVGTFELINCKEGGIEGSLCISLFFLLFYESGQMLL